MQNKRILVVTFFTPTPENYNGISGLIYHLLKKRPDDIDITLYSYNVNGVRSSVLNEIESKLKIKIKLLCIPWKIRIVRRWKFLQRCALLLPLDLYCYIPIPKIIKYEIEKNNYNKVWLYPFYFCNALFAERCKDDMFFKEKKIRQFVLRARQRQANNAEKKFNLDNLKVHFVGKADLQYYNSHYGFKNGFYSPHPYYGLARKEIKFNSSMLNVLWAGNNDMYMNSIGKKFISSLISSAEKLKNEVAITFLGKGWYEYNNKLSSCGYSSQVIEWVENYSEEIIKYDIQIIPISIGTGTKGKVLSAMVNGLLCIGTSCAFENISSGIKGCVETNDAERMCSILHEIYMNPVKYEKIAEEGRFIVLNEHDPQLCADIFFKHFSA